MSRRKLWADAFGPYGFKVRIAERVPGGVLYARVPILPYQGTGPRYREVALGHNDQDRAKLWAVAESDKLRAGAHVSSDPTPTAARVFARYCTATKYLPEKRREKKTGSQKNDARCAELWTRFLGPHRDLSKLTLADWNEFIRLRGDGLIDTRGRPVHAEDAKRVRSRTLAADLQWLRWVCDWAVRNDVLAKNPVGRDDFALPMGEEYRRPVATLDRYEKLQAVAGQIHPALPVILALAHHTARRIRAILALRYRDLVLTRTKQWPHGGITWPGMTDKQGREWVAPLNQPMRAALDAWLAAHPGIGDAFMFPDPRTGTKPVHYDTARKWLLRAETLAKVEKQNGTLFHGYRRGWAIARKNLPVQDVAAAGGWRNVNTVQQIYQAPDAATMYVVVSEPGIELREGSNG